MRIRIRKSAPAEVTTPAAKRKTTPRKNRKAVRVPKPGSLAAAVMSCPATMTDAEVADWLAREHPGVTPRRVYHTRWYYGRTERPRIGDAAVGAPPAGLKPIVNVHLPIRDRGDLLRVIAAHGTDAARDAIAAIEAHRDALAHEHAAPARESA